MKVPGYNAPQRMIRTNRVFSLFVALLWAAAAYAANSWDAPSSEMAREIAAITGPGRISLKINNRSSISTDEIPAIRKALDKELHAAGVVVQAKNASSDVRLTLSQNAQGYLWVAEVQEGSEVKVAMVLLPAAANTSPGTTAQISIHSSLLYTQADPILDAVVLGAGSEQRLIVLEPAHLKTYTLSGSTWQFAQTFDIPHEAPLPRDLRGLVAPAKDHLFDAYLPGSVCTGTTTGEAKFIAVSCSNSDDPWPVAPQKAFYNASRNYFAGVLVPGFGAKLPPFYSAAQLERALGTTTLFADISGQVHLFERGSHKMVVGARDWGSDIAGMRSDCGSGAQVLASAAGSGVSDTLRVYEVSGLEAVPASAPLSFEGEITALWASADGTAARVVVRNPQGSRYEAYSVSVACSP
jgi:hypothetical protein